MASLEFRPGVVGGGRMSQEEYERRRDACTRELLSKLQTSPEYLTLVHTQQQRQLSQRQLSLKHYIVVAATTVLSCIVFWLSEQIVWTNDNKLAPANPTYDAELTPSHLPAINSATVPQAESCSILLPLELPWKVLSTQNNQFVFQHMNEARMDHTHVVSQPEIQSSLNYTGDLVQEFISSSHVAAFWLCCIFLLWTLLQIGTWRFQSKSCITTETTTAAKFSTEPQSARDPLYGHLLILEADITRKTRDLKAAQQRSSEFETLLQESNVTNQQLRDSLERLSQAKARVESELMTKTQQLEVLQSMSESLHGQVDQLVQDQVLELFETPDKSNRPNAMKSLSLSELKCKLEQTVQQKVELQTRLVKAEELLEEKNELHRQEKEKVKELEGKVRSLNQELVGLRQDVSCYQTRSRFGPLSPSNVVDIRNSSPNAKGGLQDRQRELHGQHDEEMQHLLSRAEEEKAKAVESVMELQTQIQQLQQDKIMMQQIVDDCQASILHLKVQNSQLKEQAGSIGSSQPLSPTLSSHNSCPPSPPSGLSDKENISESALTPRMHGLEVGNLELQLLQAKAVNKELAEQLAEKGRQLLRIEAKLVACQKKYDDKVASQDVLLAFEHEEKELLSSVRSQLMTDNRNKAKQIEDLEIELHKVQESHANQVELLEQQVEQLEAELASLLTAKNILEGRVRDLEQANYYLSALVERAQEQTAALLSEFRGPDTTDMDSEGLASPTQKTWEHGQLNFGVDSVNVEHEQISDLEVDNEVQEVALGKEHADESHRALQSEHEALKVELSSATQLLLASAACVEGVLTADTAATPFRDTPCAGTGQTGKERPVLQLNMPVDGPVAVHDTSVNMDGNPTTTEGSIEMADYFNYKIESVQRRLLGQPSPGPRFRYKDVQMLCAKDPAPCTNGMTDKAVHIQRFQQKWSEVETLLSQDAPTGTVDAVPLEIVDSAYDLSISSPGAGHDYFNLQDDQVRCSTPVAESLPSSTRRQDPDVQSLEPWNDTLLPQNITPVLYGVDHDVLPSSYALPFGLSDTDSPTAASQMQSDDQILQELESRLQQAEASLAEAINAETTVREEMSQLQQQLDRMEEHVLHNSPSGNSSVMGDETECEMLQLLQRKQELSERYRRLSSAKKTAESGVRLLEAQLVCFEEDAEGAGGYDSFADEEGGYTAGYFDYDSS